MGQAQALDDLKDHGEAASSPGRFVSATLSTVASEVQDLANLSDRLQPFISAALVADADVNLDHMREFQALDLLAQRLHGVAAFVAALARAAPAYWRIDAAAAASNVTLADLAERLSGDAALETPFEPAERSASGVLELFG